MHSPAYKNLKKIKPENSRLSKYSIICCMAKRIHVSAVLNVIIIIHSFIFLLSN